MPGGGQQRQNLKSGKKSPLTDLTDILPFAEVDQRGQVIAAGEKTKAAWASGSFGIYGFAHYINSYTNIFDEKLTDQVGEYPGQSMDEPITSYWIASSHNTYLEKDQLGKAENQIFI